MHKGRRLTVLTFVGVCMLAALPILAALALVQHQARDREDHFITNFAKLLLARTDATADQLAAGAKAINALPPNAPCSGPSLNLLRRIDLESSLLQAVGRLDGNVVECSSFAGAERMALGPPDFITSLGVRVWTNVHLFPGTHTYLAYGRGRFVGIVHKELPLSAVDQIPGLTIGVLNWSHHRMMMARDGAPSPLLVDLPKAAGLYHRNGYTLALVRSAQYDVGAVAALPNGAAGRFGREAAALLLPLAMLVGAVLAFLFLRIMRARTSMPGLIRTGLRNGEFHVLFQPIVDLASGMTTGAEVLVRWHRGDGEKISPETFIPVAEAAGMVGLITTRVLELLAPEVYQLVSVNPDFRLAVNFSADDMHRPQIVEEVVEFLNESRLPADNLMIEATERSFVDADRARETIKGLRETGASVAIDDFGTGYSSLAYLAQLDVDCIKIDRLFVQALGTESATSQVAARIIEMARDLGTGTVAEGVETQEQARLLQTLGVTAAQGYLFGAPMPLPDLLQRLRQESRDSRPVPTALPQLGTLAA